MYTSYGGIYLAKKQEYGNESIKSLKGADRVRKRPAVIFGSDGIDGCQHSIFEILSILQSAFRFFSINPCISILFSFIPTIASFIYSFASSSSISLH